MEQQEQQALILLLLGENAKLRQQLANSGKKWIRQLSSKQIGTGHLSVTEQEWNFYYQNFSDPDPKHRFQEWVQSIFSACVLTRRQTNSSVVINSDGFKRNQAKTIHYCQVRVTFLTREEFDFALFVESVPETHHHVLEYYALAK